MVPPWWFFPVSWWDFGMRGGQDFCFKNSLRTQWWHCSTRMPNFRVFPKISHTFNSITCLVDPSTTTEDYTLPAGFRRNEQTVNGALNQKQKTLAKVQSERRLWGLQFGWRQAQTWNARDPNKPNAKRRQILVNKRQCATLFGSWAM